MPAEIPEPGPARALPTLADTPASRWSAAVAVVDIVDKVFNAGNLATADELRHGIHRALARAGPGTGIEGFTALVRTFGRAFPEPRISVEDPIAEGGGSSGQLMTRATFH